MIDNKFCDPVMGKTVLVTGENGYLALRTITKLLHLNYKVCITVSSTEKKELLLCKIAKECQDFSEMVNVYIMHFCSDDDWFVVMENVDYVLHIGTLSSNKEQQFEKDKQESFKNEMSRMIHFADAAGVKRVVLTSTYEIDVNAKQTQKHGLGLEALFDRKLSAFGTYLESKLNAEIESWSYLTNSASQMEKSVFKSYM